MDDRPLSILHYLPVSPRDEQWGIVCTTAGHQHVPPGTPYPVSEHPEHYLFYKGSGRTLDEYQLVYITAGRGRFESASCPSQTVEADTMLLLFPNEWHSYSPDPGTGWTEWWVGFRGANIDRLEQQGFLCRRRPLLRIGCSGGIERCYREIIGTVEEERVGFQPLISSIVLHILGSVLFKHSNLLYSDNPVVEKINRAKAIMRTDFGRNRSPEQIAREVGMGYTWFRRVFREYVGMAPAQYQHTMGTARDDSPQHLGNSLCARLRKRERLLALFPPPRTAQPQSVPRPLPGREGAVTRRGRPRQQPAGTGQSRDAPRAAQGSDTRGLQPAADQSIDPRAQIGVDVMY